MPCSWTAVQPTACNTSPSGGPGNTISSLGRRACTFLLLLFVILSASSSDPVFTSPLSPKTLGIHNRPELVSKWGHKLAEMSMRKVTERCEAEMYTQCGWLIYDPDTRVPEFYFALCSCPGQEVCQPYTDNPKINSVVYRCEPESAIAEDIRDKLLSIAEEQAELL